MLPKKRFTDLYHAGRVSCILNVNAARITREKKEQREREGAAVAAKRKWEKTQPKWHIFLYENDKDPKQAIRAISERRPSRR